MNTMTLQEMKDGPSAALQPHQPPRTMYGLKRILDQAVSSVARIGMWDSYSTDVDHPSRRGSADQAQPAEERHDGSEAEAEPSRRDDGATPAPSSGIMRNNRKSDTVSSPHEAQAQAVRPQTFRPTNSIRTRMQ
jgi:hypothetical protein